MFFVPVQQGVVLRGDNLHRTPSASEEAVETHLRLNEEQLGEIADAFHDWRVQREDIKPRQPHVSFRRMENFLTLLSSGGYYRQLAKCQGIAKSTMILHTHECADFFMEVAGQHISFPQADEFENLAQRLVDVDGIERQVSVSKAVYKTVKMMPCAMK
jgi:hypothetical protein